MAVDKNKRIKRRVRNAYIVSTVSIALVLFLLGAVGYLIMGALNATERLKENVTVYVMLRDDITAEQSAALKGRIEKHGGRARGEVYVQGRGGGRVSGLSGRRFRRLSAGKSASGHV